jgi:hypothetical protein
VAERADRAVDQNDGECDEDDGEGGHAVPSAMPSAARRSRTGCMSRR